MSTADGRALEDSDVDDGEQVQRKRPLVLDSDDEGATTSKAARKKAVFTLVQHAAYDCNQRGHKRLRKIHQTTCRLACRAFPPESEVAGVSVYKRKEGKNRQARAPLHGPCVVQLYRCSSNLLQYCC